MISYSGNLVANILNEYSLVPLRILSFHCSLVKQIPFYSLKKIEYYPSLPQIKFKYIDSSLGKTIVVNLKTKKSKIFTRGHRNPQGLVNIENKFIFETEHGPEGGDEINLLNSYSNA